MAQQPNIRFTIEGQDRASPALRTVLRTLGAVGRGVTGLTLGVARTAKSLALPAVGLASGLGAGIVLLNAATTKSVGLASAVKISTDTLEGLGSAVSALGFEADNVVDLLEEMNNKFGESAGLKITSSTADALKILGLRFKELKKLQPEEQFFKIADAIIKLPDAQKAVSAADILFGGEGNKIFGALRTQGKDIRATIADYKALNAQTDASRRGAVAFASEWSNVTTALKTGLSFAAGAIGQALAPELQKLSAYLMSNRENFREWVGSLVVKVPWAFQLVRDKIADFGKFWWKNGDQIIANAMKIGQALVLVADAIVRVAEAAATLKPFADVFASLSRFTPTGFIYRQAFGTGDTQPARPLAPAVDPARREYVTPGAAPAKAEVTVDFRNLPAWAQVNSEAPKGPIKVNVNQGFAY